jgi:hypothetical protein
MSGKGFLKFLPGLMFTIALASPALAEDASQSMKEAGHSAANAVSHAWQGTKTAVKDTDITTKVKIALHNDKLTKGHDIHVTTHDGVVTLTRHDWGRECQQRHPTRPLGIILSIVELQEPCFRPAGDAVGYQTDGVFGIAGSTASF